MAMSAKEKLQALMAARNQAKALASPEKVDENEKASDEKQTTAVSSNVEHNSEVSEERIEDKSVQVYSENKNVKVVEEVKKAESTETDPRFLEIKMMMAELEEKLNNNIPDFAMVLKNIHNHLRQDPECVTILSDEEIGTIVIGLERHSGQTITVSKTGKGSKSGKTQPVSADML